MKVAHLNNESPSPHELLIMAAEKEREGEIEEAIALYEKLLKTTRLNEKIYDRLMILYRKNKNPEKELGVINKAIAAFESHYSKPKKYSKKIIALSSRLEKATGLTDKKGNSLFEPQPLRRWKKRKKTVEKRLNG